MNLHRYVFMQRGKFGVMMMMVGIESRFVAFCKNVCDKACEVDNAHISK